MTLAKPPDLVPTSLIKPNVYSIIVLEGAYARVGKGIPDRLI